MNRIASFALGLLSFSIGSAILAFCAYSLLFPNEHIRLQFRFADVPQLLVPLALIWFGWSWMRKQPAEPAATYDSEIELTLELSGQDYGTAAERKRVLALKHRLEEVLAEDHVGEIDGEEFGDGECTIYVQTDNAAKATDAIRRLLDSEGIDRYTLASSQP